MIIDFLKIYNDIISNENNSIISEETFANINKKDVKFSIKFSEYGKEHLSEDFKQKIKEVFDKDKPKNLKSLIEDFDKILEKYPLTTPKESANNNSGETTSQQENTADAAKGPISITVKNTSIN